MFMSKKFIFFVLASAFLQSNARDDTSHAPFALRNTMSRSVWYTLYDKKGALESEYKEIKPGKSASHNVSSLGDLVLSIAGDHEDRNPDCRLVSYVVPKSKMYYLKVAGKGEHGCYLAEDKKKGVSNKNNVKLSNALQEKKELSKKKCTLLKKKKGYELELKKLQSDGKKSNTKKIKKLLAKKENVESQIHVIVLKQKALQEDFDNKAEGKFVSFVERP